MLTPTSDAVTWAQGLSAIGAVAVPILLAGFGYVLNRRLRTVELLQWQNQELLKVRLELYKQLAPQLNDLMCYFTFIGNWKAFTPPDVIVMKRRLDREFYCAAPLFSEEVAQKFDEFMDLLFITFGDWGRDAKLNTGYLRRRDAADHWDHKWCAMFAYEEGREVTTDEQLRIRRMYSALLGAMVDDTQITRPRVEYAGSRVNVGAH